MLSFLCGQLHRGAGGAPRVLHFELLTRLLVVSFPRSRVSEEDLSEAERFRTESERPIELMPHHLEG